MKKILSILISLSMLMSSITMLSAYADEPVQATTNVVWIGGSYAAGAAYYQNTAAMPAGVTAMPFAQQVTNWIDANTEGTVNYYNVAIGGTPSPNGRNRFERDVLSKNPDIVFIEYTGNDTLIAKNANYGIAYEKMALALEGMIRATQSYEKENNKDVKIVFVYRPWFTGTDLTGASYNLHREGISVYHSIADYYGIYELDAAEEAKALWEADGVEYATMVSTDNAHPTALGHYYTGKAMINILEKNPITNHKYRSLPMNLNYTEISPVDIDASDADYLDSENTIGFTADGTKMVSSNAGDKLIYHFSGTSIGTVLEKDITAKAWIYIDGKAVTNATSGRMEEHTQALAPGEHTLEYRNEGGGEIVVTNIIVDGIANEGVVAKDNFTRSVYEDTCASKDALEGRTIHHCYNLNFDNSLYSGNTFSFYPGWEDKKVFTYQLSGTTGFGENANITNVNIKYFEVNANLDAFKNIEVRAIDASGNELKAFLDEDVSYEKNGSSAGWGLFTIKAYDIPAGTTGIALYLHNTNNTALQNVKIAYADVAIDGISLDINKKWVPVDDTVATTVSQYTNSGAIQALDEGATVTYTSSDTSIATVNASGVITGVSEGRADITVTAVIDEETYTYKKPILVRDIPDYTDTELPAKPANLITNANVVNNDAGNASRTAITGVGYKYKATDATRAGAWNCFAPSMFYARTSAGGNTAVNLDYYKAGTTYVYAAKVKNSSDDTTLTPYYGIAYNKNGNFGYANTVGSNEYGKDGMPVTSTDWMDFKTTITFPADWDETSNATYGGQKIFEGLGKKSDKDAAVTLSTSLDDLYLAEEVPYEISLTAEDGVARLAQGGDLDVTAQVLDQIGIPGALNQTVSWAVVSQNREEVIEEGITVSVSGNTATLSCADTVPAGKYTVVAVSDTYNMVKGLEIDVVVDLSIKYKDFVIPSVPASLITSANALNNNAGNGGLASITGVGYKYTATQATLNGAWNVFPTSAFIARNSAGSTTAVNLDYYKAGTTYVYAAKVKNSSDDTTLTPYYGIAIPAKNTYSYNQAVGSNEYGKDGMPVTSTDWTDFKATITFPANWNEASTDAAVGQKIFEGIGKKSDLNSAVTLSTSLDDLYLAEEILYSISNEVVSGSTELSEGTTLTLKSELKDQIGLPGGLDQDVTWLALSSDRKELVDSISIVEDNETGYAAVSVTEDTPEGDYVIVAYSETYKAAKGISIRVAKGAKADVTLEQDAGYTWMNASVTGAECDYITFFIAAYTVDASDNLRLIGVTTETVAVSDGAASVEELCLGGEDPTELSSGTVVKAFAWETASQKPLELTDDSVSEITVSVE